MEELKEEQKWDGLATPISDYILFLFETLQYYKEITDVKLEIHATIGSTCDFLEILFYDGINSLPKYENSENVKNFLKLIRARKCLILEDLLERTPTNQDTYGSRTQHVSTCDTGYETIQSAYGFERLPCIHDLSVRELVIFGPNDVDMIYQMSFFSKEFAEIDSQRECSSHDQSI